MEEPGRLSWVRARGQALVEMLYQALPFLPPSCPRGQGLCPPQGCPKTSVPPGAPWTIPRGKGRWPTAAGAEPWRRHRTRDPGSWALSSCRTWEGGRPSPAGSAVGSKGLRCLAGRRAPPPGFTFIWDRQHPLRWGVSPMRVEGPPIMVAPLAGPPSPEPAHPGLRP